MEKKKVLYPCACQECKCGSKVAKKGDVCSLCRTGTHQKEIPEYKKKGESKMFPGNIENEDHGYCECCKHARAVVSILKTGMKVCLACAPKFI